MIATKKAVDAILKATHLEIDLEIDLEQENDTTATSALRTSLRSATDTGVHPFVSGIPGNNDAHHHTQPHRMPLVSTALKWTCSK